MQAEERTRESELRQVRGRARRAGDRARGGRAAVTRGAQPAPSARLGPSQPDGGSGDVYDRRHFATYEAQEHYAIYGEKDRLDNAGDGEVSETVFGEVPGPP